MMILLGCGPELVEPRAGCTVSEHIETDTVEQTIETRYDARGREVVRWSRSESTGLTKESRVETTWDDDCPVLKTTNTVQNGITETTTVQRRCDAFGDLGVVAMETMLDGEVTGTSFTEHFPTYPDDPEARRESDRVETVAESSGATLSGLEDFTQLGATDTVEHRTLEYDRRNRLIREERRKDGFTTSHTWSWWRDTSLPTSHVISRPNGTLGMQWDRDRHGRVEVETETRTLGSRTQTTTWWEDERWAPTHRRTVHDGSLYETETWTCEPGPLTHCVVDIDTRRGANRPDGESDSRRTVEYACDG